MLIDRETYFEDTEAKMTPVYDKETGEIVGWYFCPYIPKCLFDGDDMGFDGSREGNGDVRRKHGYRKKKQ